MSKYLGFSVLFGAMFAFLIAIGQTVRASKNKNYRLLVLMMLTVSLWQGHTGLLVSNIDSILKDILSFLLLPGSVAFLPLFYAYGNRILSPSFDSELPIRLAFVFFGTFLGLEAFGFLFLKKEILIELIYALSGFSRIMTILLSINLMRQAIQMKDDNRIKNFFEIRISIFLLTTTTLIGTSVSFYAQVVGQLQSDLHASGALFVSITIVLLYFLNERNPAYFDLEHLILKDRKVSLDPEKLIELERVIERLIKEEAIYRTEELNISQFTEAVNLEGYKFQQKQISEYINITFNKNFNFWINEFRIEEACKLLLERKDQTILEIAYAVGFNSKSSFNSIFKLNQGMTPNEYREKLKT